MSGQERARDTAGAPSNLSVVILTFNEEVNLPACLDSVRGLGSEVLVVDSGSTDRTLELARAAGCRIVTHAFSTHARQWAWALSGAGLTPGWVLALDADQALTPALREEIAGVMSGGVPDDVGGFFITRRQVFRGRWIRHGGYYPKYLLKLFRLDRVSVPVEDLVDHHFRVAGKTVRLGHDLIERNRKEDAIDFWIAKHVRYAELHAREELAKGRTGGSGGVSRLFGDPDERTLFLKGVWYRLPLFARSAGYFLYRYFFRLGFLDGKEGFVFHFLQGFWYRVLVDIKVDEQLRGAATVGSSSPAR